MSFYYVLTATVGSQIKTAIVDTEEIDENGSRAEDFFPPDATEVEVHGTVEIDGEAEHMIPTIIVEG
jgi:hypothetical protein